MLEGVLRVYHVFINGPACFSLPFNVAFSSCLF